MSDQDNLLEVLQADVFNVLKNTPKLSLANVILVDAETTDAKVENAVKTLVTTNGKRGLAIVVLRPEVAEGEKNLPGPPLTLKIQVQVVEQVILNRAADGTQIHSSQAALNVLSTLHLMHLGNCMVYADKDPIKPEAVKTGFVSDSVTLYTKFSGLVTMRPLQVSSSIAADLITLTCGSAESAIYYTTDGSYPSPTGTLYTAPFAAPDAGTVIRAAAYVSGQAPGDVLELTVTA